MNNLVMFVVDALNRDCLSCYGFPLHEISPNIDRIARYGTLFTNASADGRTIYSTARLMTATDEFELTETNIVFPERPTLPEVLEESGVNYYLVIANGLAAQGFQEAGWDDDRMTSVHRKDEMNHGETATKAIEVLQRLRNEDGPFFLIVWFMTVHDYNALDIYRQKWHEDFRINDPEGWQKWRGDEHKRDVQFSQYVRSISIVDSQILRVMHSYDFMDTPTIFTADHGEKLHPWWTHRKNQDVDLINVPLLLYPGREKRHAQICSKKVNWIDLTPTVCEILDIDYPKNEWKGKSFYIYSWKDSKEELKDRLEALGYV